MISMDPESRQLLEKTYSLAKENNQILHGIRRSQRIASFMRALYWVIILAVTFGSFYLLEPYVNKMLDLYNSISGTEQKLNSGSLQDLLKNFRN